MRWLRGLAGWLSDWRTGLALAATGFVALLIVVTVANSYTAHDALDARQDAAERATRRIDRLTAQIERLTDEARANGQRIGQANEQITVLQEQVRQLGGQPVVVIRPSTSSTTTTPPRRPPTTTPTPSPRPSPTTTTTQPARPCVLGLICPRSAR